MKIFPIDHPTTVLLATAISATLGLCAIYVGTVSLADPTGATLEIPNLLSASDFRLAGIWLILMGLAYSLSSVGLWRNFSWGWPLALATGIVTIFWLVIGVTTLGYISVLQPIILLGVICELHLLFRPKLIRYTLS